MKRRYAIASIAVMAANLKMLGNTKAQTQVVSNTGQVVSTGDVVIRQSAGGQQYVYDAATDSWQVVSNDLQVVSTGNVAVDQSAAAVQETTRLWTYHNVPPCVPGSYKQANGCIWVCAEDGCSEYQFCCESQDSCRRKGKCGK